MYSVADVDQYTDGRHVALQVCCFTATNLVCFWDACPSACWECRVMRAGELRQKDVAWPFKIVYILDTNIKVHYFSAANEGDMKVSADCSCH